MSAAANPPVPRAVVLLGAQRTSPSLPGAVATMKVRGPVATITAGWQDREDEDEELVRDLGGRAAGLRLYARSLEVFAQDPELRAEHLRKQNTLRELQDIYRIRLECALSAWQRVSERQGSLPQEIDVLAEALEAVRDLDRRHLQRCEAVHREFERRVESWQRPAIRRHRSDIKRILQDCEAVAIAGGHIATLANRLRLFGIAELIGPRTVFAWSGGAMCCSERVVLFHEDTPQGAMAPELFDRGLALVPGVILFPQPEQRLRLHDTARVSRTASRFLPSRCVALPARAALIWQAGSGFIFVRDALQLRPDGSHEVFALEQTG